ncbi:MAG TPA: DUF6069 family protein [Nitrolancea sp.]|nr:DUF6069 family protein [Nitrolancea sp.]
MNHQLVRTYARLTDCEQSTWKRFATGALFVAVVAIGAAIVNLIVYAIASSLGAVSESVDLVGTAGLSAGLIAVTTGIGIALAASTLALVGWLSRRPVRTFRIVATVALALSFLPVLSLPGAPASMKLTLLSMHIVAWAASISLLPSLAHAPDRS